MNDTYRKNILRILDNKGMSAMALEKRLGYSNAYIRHINDGTAPYQRLKAIADELGVPLSEIVSENVTVDTSAKIGYEEFMLLQNQRLVSYMKKIAELSDSKRDYIYDTIDIIS